MSDRAAIHAAIDQIRLQMCGGKRSHRSQYKAEVHLSKLGLKYSDAAGMHVYGCVFCNGYHVGRPPRGARLRQMEKILNVENLIDYDFDGRGVPE